MSSRNHWSSFLCSTISPITLNLQDLPFLAFKHLINTIHPLNYLCHWTKSGHLDLCYLVYNWGFIGKGFLMVKNLTTMQEDLGSIARSGRSPGEGNGNPLQHSCLRNAVNRGGWQTTVHGGHKEVDMTERLTFSHSLL